MSSESSQAGTCPGRKDNRRELRLDLLLTGQLRQLLDDRHEEQGGGEGGEHRRRQTTTSPNNVISENRGMYSNGLQN